MGLILLKERKDSHFVNILLLLEAKTMIRL